MSRVSHRFHASALMAVVSLVSVSISDAAEVPLTKGDATDVVTMTDIPYAKVNGTELKLDLMLPTGTGPFPAVVVIHGGAWRGGTSETAASSCQTSPAGATRPFLLSIGSVPRTRFPLRCRT